jgi:hypothetical protein
MGVGPTRRRSSKKKPHPASNREAGPHPTSVSDGLAKTTEEGRWCLAESTSALGAESSL